MLLLKVISFKFCSRDLCSIIMSRTLSGKIEGALIDLSGTLHVEDKAVGNAVPALERYVKLLSKYCTD